MTQLTRSVFSGLVATASLLLFFGTADALMGKHECGFCHSLHGADTGFVPRSDQINMEVLCMGCHLTANGATAAVQPHKDDGGYPAHYVTCTDCHEVHDNMENWRLNDPTHAADDDAAGRDGTDVRPGGWPVGVNTKMVGREDPDGETPYAIIITKERDMNKDGVPDRNIAQTQTCDDTLANDCYVTRKRHVIFENRDASDSAQTIHAWADHDEDGLSPADAGWETITEWGDTAGGGHDAICHMCHTVTSKNACGYDGSADCTLHNQARACTDCHLHDGCFDKGSGCTPWTMPNRDVRMDTVDASPTSANSGQTVAITADFTNLGDATEVVRVKFYSSIDRYLGTIDVTDVAPGGGTGQAIFNWLTTTDGDHVVSAEAQPVLAEINVANNTATFATPVTVAATDTHDIAVTSVSAPSPIQQGDTVTVTVNITNQGTFTEGPFDVTLSSDLDGAIGTLSVTTIAPSASTAVDFSWNTSAATLGTHVLTGTAVITDDVPGNNSATTNADVAVHDVAVTSVTAPPQVEVNSSATVSVDITNEGGFTETFNVTLSSDQASDGNLPQVLSSGALAAGASTTLDFTWNTTGATETIHTLTATADTVTGETDTADNSASTTSEVIPPTNHDVAVDLVTAPATVVQGTSDTVSVQVSNNGGATETFNVTLSSDLDGTIQVLSSGALVAGNSTVLVFTWNTDISTTPGLHTLTATADTVPGETITLDNANSTTSTVTWHDVSADSVTAPASTTQGDPAAVDVVVTNNGDFTETFNVTLASNLDGTIQTLSSGALGAGAGTTLNFSWNTTGATIATHTLTATAATVPGELDTSNNSASTTADVASAGPVNDLAVTAIAVPSSIATCGSKLDISMVVTVENLGTVTETAFSVSLTSVPTTAMPAQQVASLAAGATVDLTYIWRFGRNDTCGAYDFTATAGPVAGETNTANNSLGTTVTIN